MPSTPSNLIYFRLNECESLLERALCKTQASSCALWNFLWPPRTLRRFDTKSTLPWLIYWSSISSARVYAALAELSSTFLCSCSPDFMQDCNRNIDQYNKNSRDEKIDRYANVRDKALHNTNHEQQASGPLVPGIPHRHSLVFLPVPMLNISDS